MGFVTLSVNRQTFHNWHDSIIGTILPECRVCQLWRFYCSCCYPYVFETEVVENPAGFNGRKDWSGHLKDTLHKDMRMISLVHEVYRHTVDPFYYAKGSFLMHMISGVIGAQTLQKAMRAYIAEFAYKSVTTESFLTALDKVAAEENTLGWNGKNINMTLFLHNYLYLPSFPVVFIRFDTKTQQYILHQQPKNPELVPHGTKWVIPVWSQVVGCAIHNKTDVEQSLIHAQELFSRHSELKENSVLASNQELEWILTELRNTLRSVEWDLEDLGETIGIVERNPSKFKLKTQEIVVRKRFIQDSQNLIQLVLREGFDQHQRNEVTGRNTHSPSLNYDIRDKMSFSDSRFKDRTALLPPPPSIKDSPVPRTQYKYSRLLENEDMSNAGTSNLNNDSRHFADTFEQQQLIIRNQDEDLEQIGGSVHVLKNMSQKIGNELEEHSVMLDDLGRDMDRTDSKLDNVMKKLAKVTHMSNDKRQWTVILVLLAVIVVIIILFAVL